MAPFFQAHCSTSYADSCCCCCCDQLNSLHTARSVLVLSPSASAAALLLVSGHTHSSPPACCVGNAVAQLRWLAHAVEAALGSSACGMLLQDPSFSKRHP